MFLSLSGRGKSASHNREAVNEEAGLPRLGRKLSSNDKVNLEEDAKEPVASAGSPCQERGLGVPSHPPTWMPQHYTDSHKCHGRDTWPKKKKHANLQSIPSLFANFTHILRNPSQRIQADRPIPCPARVRIALGTDRSWRSEKEAPGLPHLE